MGELIELWPYLRNSKEKETADKFGEKLIDIDFPSPETLGWVVTGVAAGLPIRYFDPNSEAAIGYVPGNVDKVYLDYKSDMITFEMSLEELAWSIETGTLP